MFVFGLIALALAPAICVIAIVFFQDKHEREPLKYTLFAFLLGIMSFYISLWLGQQIMTLYQELLPVGATPNPNGFLFSLFFSFVTIALSEELAKFLFCATVLYRSPEFDDPYDGIFYCVVISMGFASIENLIFVLEGGYNVALLRMLTSVPAHAFFGSLMGYFLGLAKFRERKMLYFVTALLAATVLHGTYDFFAGLRNAVLLSFGAFFCLFVGYYLFRRAIIIHNQMSRYRE